MTEGHGERPATRCRYQREFSPDLPLFLVIEIIIIVDCMEQTDDLKLLATRDIFLQRLGDNRLFRAVIAYLLCFLLHRQKTETPKTAGPAQEISNHSF